MSEKHQTVGHRNPKGLDESSIPLYETEGQVHSVADFAAANTKSLTAFEADLVNRSRDTLASHAAIPRRLRTCLSRSAELRTSSDPVCTVARNGARSTYWQDFEWKLKGCRPVLSATTFPLEHLTFGSTSVMRKRIPFGVMSAEAVMREILAYCFQQQYGLPISTKPLCVFEYRQSDDILGFCLVCESEGETRMEAFIEYPSITVGEVIRAQSHAPRDAAGLVLGSELRVKHVNVWWWAETKARLLSAMHFRGGFRGILNSNIGNDVIVSAGSLDPCLLLCDFDTFEAIPLPDGPSLSFLSAFTLKCVVEVAKGSLSILEYVSLPPDCDADRRAALLGQVYFQRSSLWRAYERHFMSHVRRCSWDPASVQQALDMARHTEAFADVLSSCILNTHYLEKMASTRGVYYPHN